MSIRHGMKMVAVSGAATVCAAVFALSVGSGVAGADLSSGPTTLSTPAGTTAGAPVTAGHPYTSGEVIAVNVAANSTMNNTALAAAGVPTSGNFYLLECTDTNGTLPSGPSNCEAATVITAAHGSDGSMSATGTGGFTVYDLPDSSLGAPTMTGKCDLQPNDCVVGIFSENPGSAGAAAFSTPHLFSAPFQTTVGDGADIGNNPGDGTPEVPLAIGLPLAAVAVFGGFTLRNRRRRQRQAA